MHFVRIDVNTECFWFCIVWCWKLSHWEDGVCALMCFCDSLDVLTYCNWNCRPSGCLKTIALRGRCLCPYVFLGGPPLVGPPLEPGLSVSCFLFPVSRHLTWTHNIFLPSWWNWIKLFGDIPWVFVYYFQKVLNFLYVCQSVSWLTSLLK